MNPFLYGLGNGLGYGLMNTLNYAMFGSIGYNPLMFGGSPFIFGGGCCCNHNPMFFIPPAMGSGIALPPSVSIFC